MQIAAQVAPFELKDATRPGHRTILAFFLVDPAVPVVSTLEVPYQNRAWLERLLMACIARAGLPELSAELIRAILKQVEGVIAHAAAVDRRAALMEIRKSGDFLGDDFEQECSLCEH